MELDDGEILVAAAFRCDSRYFQFSVGIWVMVSDELDDIVQSVLLDNQQIETADRREIIDGLLQEFEGHLGAVNSTGPSRRFQMTDFYARRRYIWRIEHDYVDFLSKSQRQWAGQITI